MKSIKAHVYAQVDYGQNKTGYGFMTFSDAAVPLKDSMFKKQVMMGVCFGVGVYIADDIYESITELVKTLTEGVAHFYEKCHIDDFNFSFEYPDYLSVCYTKTNGVFTTRENILTRERPLNENEREEFARAFAALSNKRNEPNEFETTEEFTRNHGHFPEK